MEFKKGLYSFIKIAFSIMIVLLIIYAAVSISTLCYDFGYRVFTEPAMEDAPGRDVLVQVKEDMSEKELGEMLEEKGLVRDANLFRLQLKLSAYSKLIKPGVYTLNTSMTAKDMMVVMSADVEESTEDTEIPISGEGTTEAVPEETGE